MSTPCNKQSFNFPVNQLRSMGSSAMSPITDLTINLGGLSTKLSSTPCRRISWTNLTPDIPQCNKISFDSPMSTDSPMFQEGILRGLQPTTNPGRKDKLISKVCRKISQNTFSDDKENISNCDIRRYFRPSSENSSKTSSSLTSNTDEYTCASQESGYGGSQDDRKFHSFISQSSIGVYSSVFTDEELGSDDSMIIADKLVDDDENAIGLSSTMTELFRSSPAEFRNNEMPSTFSTARRRLSLLSSTENMSEHASLTTFSGCVVNHDRNIKPIETNVEKKKVFRKDNEIKYVSKRIEPIDGVTPLCSKRRRSCQLPELSSTEIIQPLLTRCYSETAATIMSAVHKSDEDPDLIGDCSKPFSLPLAKGRHEDLRTITPETLMNVLNGHYRDSVDNCTVIDCRYPYEYEGGHIVGAKNIYTKDNIYDSFLSRAEINENKRDVLVFHCEFSSERAPKLLRFLRNKDRELNNEFYPRLYHPEMYILEGGYKAFYQNYKEFCEPPSYKPMLHRDHSIELKEFRSKSKTWGGDKTRPKLRSNLNF